MKPLLLTICLAGLSLCLSAQNRSESSADLLFGKSDLTGALRKSTAELRHNPRDVNAHFVRMEGARLELRNREELHSAIAILQNIPAEDSRAKIASERIRQLAANTPQFRAVLPQIAKLLASSTPYAIELGSAVLAAAADGTALPGRIRLAHRITQWQVAGPFGQFPNVDSDRSWSPEADELRNSHYDRLVREQIDTDSGELELPEYFAHSGIYYAAAQFTAKDAKYRLTIESDGTYEVRIDGVPVLAHDARFVEQTATTLIERQISAGNHRLLVKLQPSALPIRIWIEPFRDSHPARLKVSAPEGNYLKAATALLNGDPGQALAFDDRAPSAMGVLKAEALAQRGEEQRSRELYRSISSSDSRNLLAAFKVAEEALKREQYEEALAQLAKVLKSAPAFPQAQELKFDLAAHFNWRTEEEASLRQRLRLHPGCTALADAVRFYDANSQADLARHYELAMATCSPRPSQFWEQLSMRGRHAQARANISKYIAAHLNDRHAMTTAVREAVLDNDLPAASRYAKHLHVIAPNWSWAALLAGHPESVLDSRSSYSAANRFYKPFVRDPLPPMRERETQVPDSRVLINDRVVKLDSAGAWVYQHTVTQIFSKKAITRLGEVEVPRAVDLLEVRTVKTDGTMVDAEPGENKKVVSMPSLAEGDAIEIAYLQHIALEVLATSPEVLDFAFASSQSPTRSARLTLIRDHTAEPLLWHSPTVRCIHSEPTDDVSTTTWEIASVPAIQAEPAAPQYDRRPRVLWLAIDREKPLDAIAKIRDELVAATKVSFRIRELATELQSSSKDGLSAAYRYVIESIEDEAESWQDANITSADDSLEQGEGSRTATLIALLSAMGYEADLALARERGKHDPGDACPNARCYTHPLVRITIPDSGQVLLDPKLDGVASGALSPDVEGEAAIIISRSQAPVKQSFLIPCSTDQHSQATASLRLDDAGNLSGKIQIRFGSLRGAQMREILRSIPARERAGVFEEIASRILPTTNDVSATVSHEDDPEQALELELTVRAPKFGRWNGSQFQFDQLVPALGLSRLYATLPERQQAVLLDTPLVETTEFVISLPAGLEAVRVPEAIDLKSQFGEYHSTLKTESNLLKVTRSFRIPAQVVAPADYRAFSDFALQVDSAEKQLIQLRRTHGVETLAHAARIAQPSQPLH